MQGQLGRLCLDYNTERQIQNPHDGMRAAIHPEVPVCIDLYSLVDLRLYSLTEGGDSSRAKTTHRGDYLGFVTSERMR